MNTRRLAIDAFALGLLAVGGFLALSLLSYNPADPPSSLVYPTPDDITNLAGSAGAKAAHGLRTAFGLGAYFLLFAVISFDMRLFARKTETKQVETVAPTAESIADKKTKSKNKSKSSKDESDDASTYALANYPTYSAEFETEEVEVDLPIPVYSRLVGLFLGMVGVGLLMQLMVPTLGASTVGNGGYLGSWTAFQLAQEFAPAGVFMLAATMTASAVVLSVDFVYVGMFLKVLFAPVLIVMSIVSRTRSMTQKVKDLRNRKPASDATAATTTANATKPRRTRHVRETHTLREEEEDDFDANEQDDESTDLPTMPLVEDDAPVSDLAESREIRVNPPMSATAARDQMTARLEASSRESIKPFQLPSLDLLEDAEDFPYDELAASARIAAATLEKTFGNFGLNVRVVEIDTGPVITQFELELEAGLRLNKVTALADDLAIALRVPSVRVVAPIPGKNTVGVEVPNEKRVMVRLRELVESCPSEFDKKRIPIYLGKDVSGRPLVVDLTKMPHLLIAGRTGTGKSVCLNTLILSMLMTRRPDQVKMLLIDPKMVELSPYKRVPHLMHPVITDMKKAEAVLSWAVDKMEERYDLLSRVGVRHLDNYNKLDRETRLQRMEIDPDSPEADEVPDDMPYIVIVADEMADMMMTSGKDVEGHIIRLAQKSRAVGIHLVLATQKPTVDVITGLIKSNLPARISFQVASKTDSRVVLDENGADRLLGNGDMLYLAPGTSNVNRAQGTFVSDDECNAIIDFYSDYEPDYCEELAQVSAAAAAKASEADGPEVKRNRDDLYDEAITCVVREGRGSVSLLQRALGIGYGRAARLIDYMAEDGIVGDYNGSQAREVLFTMSQWEATQAGLSPEDVSDEDGMEDLAMREEELELVGR